MAGRPTGQGPQLVVFNGKIYRLSQEQYQRLYPQIKGLNDRERAQVGYEFLLNEGILKGAHP